MASPLDIIKKDQGMSPLQMIKADMPQQPEPDEGILSNLVKGGVTGVANTIGGTAGWFGGKNSVTDWAEGVERNNQRSREYDGYDLDYILNGSGLAYDVGNLLGSVASMAIPSVLIPGGVGATGARLASGLLGRIGAGTAARYAAQQAAKEGGGALGNYIRYGLGSGTIESAVEGGSGVTRAVEEGRENPYAIGAEIFAKNWPLLVASQVGEGALLHRGFSRLGGKAGESLGRRAAMAPLRTAPYMAGEGLAESGQEIMQERAQEEAFGEPTGGLLPSTWTENEKKAFYATALPAALLGGVSGVRGSMRQAPATMPPERHDYLAYWDDTMGKIDPKYSSMWHSEGGETNLTNLQESVAAAWNGVASEYGGGLTITGGAETSAHEGGENGHHGGWKLDIDKASVQDEDRFLELCRKYGFAVGDEGNHYDLSLNPKGGVGGEVKVSHEEAGQGNAPANVWSGNENAKAIYDVFRAAGYNNNAIAGILGRVQQEHSFDTSDVEEHWDYTPEGEKVWVGGYGMFQWNGGRTTEFLNWAQKNGLDPQNPTVQAQYALIEAQQRGLTPEAMNGLTHEQAADKWTKDWEVGRPGDERKYAGEWLQRLQNGGGVAGGATPNTTNTKAPQVPTVDTYDDVYEQFAREQSQTSDEETKDFFSGMFTKNDKFIDTEENRRKIDERYGEELKEFADVYRNPSVQTQIDRLIDKAAKEQDSTTWGKLQAARKSGDIQLMQKYLDEAKAKEAPQMQGEPVPQVIPQQTPAQNVPQAQPAFPIVQTPAQNAPQPAQQTEQAQPIQVPTQTVEAPQSVQQPIQQEPPAPQNVSQQKHMELPQVEGVTDNVNQSTESTQAQADQTAPVINQNQYTKSEQAEEGQEVSQPIQQEAPQPAQQGGLVNTTYTTKKGEVRPAVTWDGRVDKDEFNRRKELSKQYNGWWNSKTKAFTFKNEQDRDAFVAAVNVTPAQSEAPSQGETNEESSLPTSAPVQEAPKKKSKALSQFKKTVAKVVEDYKTGKVTYEEAFQTIVDQQVAAERVAPDEATIQAIRQVAEDGINQLNAIFAEKQEAPSQTAQESAGEQETTSQAEEPAQEEKPAQSEAKPAGNEGGEKSAQNATVEENSTTEQPKQENRQLDNSLRATTDSLFNEFAEAHASKFKPTPQNIVAWRSAEDVAEAISRPVPRSTDKEFTEKHYRGADNYRDYIEKVAALYCHAEADNDQESLASIKHDVGEKLSGKSAPDKAMQYFEYLIGNDTFKAAVLGENAEPKQEKPARTENNTVKTPEQMNERKLEEWLLHASKEDVEQWAKTTPYKKVAQAGSSFITDTFYNTETGQEFVICVRDYDYNGERDIDVLYYMPIDKEAYRAWQHKHGKIVEGDVVEVVKGRKVPVGTISRVKKIRSVRDKYGRWVADYADLENGQSTNVENCQRIEEGHEENKEVKSNEQQAESGSLDGGHGDMESGGGREDQREGTGEVSGRDGREGEAVGRDDGQEHSEESQPAGVRAGAELEAAAGKGADKRGNQPEIPLTEAEAHPSPTETPGHNYEIKDTDQSTKSEKVRFKQNVEAIKMLKQLEADDRMPTPAEQEILAGYNGWGGLKGAFIEGSDMNKEIRELLTEEEYKAARSTINDAFYTPPKLIRAIWEGISHLGFKGGRILDPSMGVGNFFGTMPRDMMEKSTLRGVELDDLTSRLGRMLYPGAFVEHKGFQKSAAADNYFDLAISNIPFGQSMIDGYQVHNFFFANGIDKVRPGGLMVYITSQGSLAGGKDAVKMRNYLAGQADLIAAYKLPSGVFSDAGTQVATDIVVFRKRDKDGKKSPYGQKFADVKEIKRGEGYYAQKLYDINEYFEAHPENILGEQSNGKDQWGNPALNVKMAEGTSLADVASDLEKAMKKLPENVYQPTSRKKSKAFDAASAQKRAAAAEKTRDYEYYYKDGKPVQNQNGQEVEITGAKAKIIDSYLKLKGTLNALFAAESDPRATNKQVESLRKKLNKDYDSFVAKHGLLTGKAAAAFRDDPSAGMVQALEKPKEETYKDKKGNERKRIVGAEKADIFSVRSIKPVQEVTHVESADDALIASLTNRGGVDLDYMAGLMNSKPEKLVSQLKGKVFRNPVTEDYETREEYLSGNVREKLAQAQEAAKSDKAYADNVKELEKVVPEDLVSDEIYVNLGTPWIPVSDVQEFLNSIGDGLTVKFSRGAALWNVTGWGRSAKYKLKGMALGELVDHVLNNKAIQIYDGTGDNKVFNKEKTDAANVAAEELQQDFHDWIWKDKEREKRLVRYYNDNYNNTVVRQYNGQHLNLHNYGMNAKITLKPHQKDVVWRMLQGQNTLIAHCVGAGKTFEMQAAGMEMRRLGIANKPMYCLPNNVVQQFAREFRILYPNAKLLVLQSNDLPAVEKTSKLVKTEDGRTKRESLLEGKTPEQKAAIMAKRTARNRMLNRIRTEDWDGIIISHNLFQRFPVTPDTAAAFIQQEIDNLEQTIREARADRSMDTRALSNMENAKKNLEERLEDAISTDIEDIGVPFEELGIDQLFVDEADMFKNLEFATRLGNIRGLSNSKANRSRDMFIKTQWLTNTLNGRGVVFATGTPVSNTMSELYTMMRYLDMKGLKEKGLELFDNWLRTFGDIGQGIERKPTGDGFRKVTMIKRFINMAELTKMFRKFADVKVQEELNLNIPKLKDGKTTVVALEPDPGVVNYIKKVVPERVKKMKSGFKKEKGEDNMLSLTNDLRKLSLTDSKIEACADAIVKKYHETTDVKGTQLVFCDMGIPKAEKGETALTDKDGEAVAAIENPEVYRKLIEKLKEKGIPEKDVAFIQNYNTKQKRDGVFQKVNDGEVRILIGSTETMGAGTNCQKHLVALHDLDAPWRPRDLEQRHGRILRQGNDNKEVEIFNYVVKDSFDANMWEKLKNKAAIIQQAMSGDMNMRTVEDADLVTLSYAEVEGAATGNPLIKEQLQVQNDLTKYQHAQTAFRKKVRDAENLLDGADERVEKKKREIAKVEKDIAQRKDTKGDKFSMLIGDKGYKERGKADEALAKVLENLTKRNPVVIGKIGGFTLKGFYNGVRPQLFLVNNLSYDVNTESVQGIEYVVQHGPEAELKRLNSKLSSFERDVEQAREIVAQENPYAAKVKELSDRLNQLNREIADTLVDDGKQTVDVAQKGVEAEYQNFSIEETPSGAYKVKLKDSQTVSNKEDLARLARMEDGYTGSDGDSFTFSKRINAVNFARNRDSRVERAEKPSSNRKYSIDNSDNLGYNNGRKYSVVTSDEGLVKTHDDWTTNRIYADANGVRHFEPLYEVEENESSEKRYRRRMMEVARIDAGLEDGEYPNPYINFIGEIGRAEIDNWVAANISLKTIMDTLKARFEAAVNNNELRDGLVVLQMMSVKGGMEYVKELAGRNNNARGNLQNAQDGRQAENRNPRRGQGNNREIDGRNGNGHQNSIRESRSDESGFSIARSMEEIKAETIEAFPGAKVQESGNKLTFTMPNGQKVTFTFHESITVSDEELSRAKREHGIDQRVTVTVEGYAEAVDGEGFGALSQGSRKGTGFHEAYHIAEAIAFTKKELADAKRLISANEEERADAYARWKMERKKHSNFAKLWQKIADVAAKLAGILGYETKRNIFRKVESGEIYQRDNTARNLSRKYSVNASDNSNDSYKQRLKNFFGKGKKDTPSYRRMLKGMMEEIADVKISYGRLDEGMEAIYKSAQKVIRVRNANDWERVVPLFAGAVCEKIGIKPSKELNHYISDWLQNGAPNNNSAEADTFAKAMRENPDVADQLLDLQSAFMRWNQMDAMEKMQSIISRRETEKTSLSSKLEYAYDQLIEELGPVKRLVKQIEKKTGKLQNALNPYVAFRLFRGHHGRAMTMLEGSGANMKEVLARHYPNLNWDGFKTLHEILDSVGGLHDEKIRDEFGNYALACHVYDIHLRNDQMQMQIDMLEKQLESTKDEEKQKKLKERIERLDRSIMLTPISRTDCGQIIREYGDKYGQAQQDLVHFSNMTLAILKDSGVISETRYNRILSRWPNYVPMFRVFDENEKKNFGDSLQALEGSTRDVIDPLESIIRNTFDFVKKAEKNKAKCLLARLAQMSDVGKYIEPVANNKPNADTVITYYVDGEKKYLETDPSVVAAVNGMGIDQSNLLMKIIRFPARLARAAFTVTNPAFLFRNTLRDTQDAFIYNDRGTITPMDFVRAFMHAFRKDDIYWEWMSSGAAQASAISIDRDYAQATLNSMTKTWKQMFKENILTFPFKAFLDATERVAEFSELGTRIAAYERTKKALGKEGALTSLELAEAAYESRDLMDFARGGKASRQWNSLAIFANASLQGWDKFFRTFNVRENPKAAMRAMARLAIGGMLPALVLTLANWDEDWWKEIPDWQKDSHWILAPNVRIPKGQDIGLRFVSSFIEKGLDAMHNNNPMTAKRTLKPVYEQTPDIMPTALLPIIEAIANYSFFKEAPIVPQYQKDLPAKLQYAGTTSGLAKALGDLLDYSPRKIDHLISGYTGSVGKGALSAVDIAKGDRRMNTAMEELPVLSGVMMTPYKNSATVEKFYKEFRKQTEGDKAFKATHERMEGYSPAKYKRMSQANKKMSELNKKERRLLDDNRISPERKQELQAGIMRQRIAIAKSAMR